MKKIASLVLNDFTADARVLKEGNSLAESGCQVIVYALHDRDLERKERIKPGFEVDRVVLSTKNWPRITVFQILKWLEWTARVAWRARGANIVHCHDLNTLPVGVLLKILSFGSKVLIYDSHEYAINDIPHQSSWSIRTNYLLEYMAIKFADRVITVSNGIADEYARLYKIEKPIVILNAPPYVEIVKENRLKQELSIPGSKRIFLYQGRLSPGRGIELILETFAMLNDGKNVVVFMGNGPLRDMVVDRASRSDNIYYHPAVPQADLLNYTSSADVGILYYENTCLNHEYCSPNKIFEYLMAEIPVIVSNLAEMKKLVEKHGVGIVTPDGSCEGLLAAVKAASSLENPSIKNAIRHFKSVFNWEAQEKVLLDLYRELV